jgi:hypothetical protein
MDSKFATRWQCLSFFLCRLTQGAFNFLKKIYFLFFVRSTHVPTSYAVCMYRSSYAVCMYRTSYACARTLYIVFKYAVHCTPYNVHHTLYASTSYSSLAYIIRCKLNVVRRTVFIIRSMHVLHMLYQVSHTSFAARRPPHVVPTMHYVVNCTP